MSMRSHYCRRFLILLCSLLGGTVQAQNAESALEFTSKFELNGSVDVGAWSSDRNLSEHGPSLNTMLTLNANWKIAPQWRFRANGSAFHFAQSSGKDTQGKLREANLQWEGEQSAFKLGSQIVAWGRADRINPTDNLTARDYTTPFASDDEQRIGSLAALWSQDFTPQTRASLIVKEFRASRGPSDFSERALPLRLQDNRPELAFKLDHSGENLDWSLSYFKGKEKLRSLEQIRMANRTVGVSRGYAALEVLGADAATTLGAIGLRGELAYQRFPVAQVASSTRLSHWFGVLGVETNLANSATISAQYFFRRFQNDPAPRDFPPALQSLNARLQLANNQLHQLQDGMSLRYAQRLKNDQLDYELVALVNFRDKDFGLRPRLNYRYSDGVKIVIGCDVFRGRTQSFFGSLRKNSLGFADLVFIF